MDFEVNELPLLDSPLVLGFANARQLALYQANHTNSLTLVRDEATLWRSRDRDGQPVPIYVARPDITERQA